MLILLIPIQALACNYPIRPGQDCIGSDTRTVLGEFSMVWVWISATVLFFFGYIISIIRDIIPRAAISEDSDRYFTGESRSVLRFFVEENLFTGWVVTKNAKRFSNTSRWSLIVLIIYTEMFITGALYQKDYDNPSSFQSKDFLYGLVGTAVAFIVYLVGYYFFVIRIKDEVCSWRLVLGYIFTAIVIILCLILVFVFTYKAHNDTSKDYSSLVTHWCTAFGYSLLLEVLVSENIRIITRAVIIWSKKFDPEEPLHTNIELSYMEKPKKQSDSEEFE